MTCTILAAWTSGGASVPVGNVQLTGAANLKLVAVGRPCDTNAKSCGVGIDTITGAPVQAWVSGC